MVLVLIFSIAVLIASFLVYLYKDVYWAKKKLDWLPQAPSLPLLGGCLEFGSSQETLNDMARLTNNPAKSCFVQIAYQWSIIVRDYDLLEFILSSTSNAVMNKSYVYEFFNPWLGTGLLTAPGRKWKGRRKIITPAFHFSILEQFIEVFESNGNILIEKLASEAVGKDSVDIYEYITNCALDTICEAALGVTINTQKNQNQDYVFAVKDVCRIILSRAFSSWKRVDFLFELTKDGRLQHQHLKILHGKTNSIIEQRRKILSQNKANNEKVEEDAFGRKRKMAFLDLLLNTTVDGQPLSQEDIREEVDTFMFEGHDTTASGLTFALNFLAQHPEVQKLVREEQRRISGDDRNKIMTYQDLQDMKYLEMVVKESLRLYPSVPFVGRLTSEDVNYKGHIIPKNTALLLFIYGINRDPDYYEDPDEFKPERWADNAGKKPYSYIPFSAGPRNCIGQRFAMLEMKSVISKIIRNFELYPTNPPHKLVIVNESILKSTTGVKIRVKKYDW